ncbi:MAG: MucB/RseB C-terminal domain-containing protein, partial [Pseudomonadota bacterium]
TDRFRFGYRLWLDQETALPLKTMTVGDRGHVVELMHFTAIDFPDEIADEALAATLSSDGFGTLAPTPVAEHDQNAQTQWEARRLPVGFRLSLSSRERSREGNQSEHLVYSDGLASVSVFIESATDPGPNRPNLAELGAASAFSRVLGGFRIIVVGEVPADTVTMIGRSMRRVDDAAREPVAEGDRRR